MAAKSGPAVSRSNVDGDHGMTGNREANGWVITYKENNAAHVRLVCFPYSGAGASIFASWRRWLPENVAICAIQLPGRQNRLKEPPFTRINPLIAELGPALLPLLDKPFAFFGHSMGATVSFEMARWLRRNRNLMPEYLFVSGHRAPHLPRSETQLHMMNDADFLNEIIKMNGMPKEVLAEPEVIKLALPALRADLEICETYRFEDDAPLDCPITAFCGKDDEEETMGKMAEWRLHTRTDFSLHELPGNHFFLHPSERRLLELLKMELAKAVLRY
jgi:medium-chain acyl-[acyl-carrier-protein] hydrolase